MRTHLCTALYHSLPARSVWSDVDGRYGGPEAPWGRASDARPYSQSTARRLP